MPSLDFSNDPKNRPKTLHIHQKEPFNAEPEDLAEFIKHYITPTNLVYGRNHGPIPDIKEDEYVLTVDGVVNDKLKLTLSDLKAMPKVDVVAALQCAGNRRESMSKIRETEGIPWSNGTISNCIYTGVQVSHILQKAGLPSETQLHVAFTNHSPVQEDSTFASSIPLHKALDPHTLLAYEMNHEKLSRDHGFPVRVIVPGYAGARSVKWLDTITVQRSAADNFYMQRDYKVLPEDVTTQDREDMQKIWDSVPPLQEMGVQSAICSPRSGETVESLDGEIEVRGYAVVGEDGPIKAVHISTDQGTTWKEAKIVYQEGLYSWTLWHCWVSGVEESTKIWSRAESASGQLQPIQPVWNLRGVMSNGISEVTNLKVVSK